MRFVNAFPFPYFFFFGPFSVTCTINLDSYFTFILLHSFNCTYFSKACTAHSWLTARYEWYFLNSATIHMHRDVQ